MTKKNLLIVGGICISALFLWRAVDQTDRLETDDTRAESENRLEENREKMTVLYQAPRETISADGNEVTGECLEFWNRLRGYDLTRQQSEFPDIKAITKSERCGIVPAPLKKVHEHFNKTCSSNANSSQCLVALYFYRAAVSDYLTRNMKTAEIQDPKILVDKILANREINPGLSIQAAERLSEVDPTLYEAKKASVLGRLYMATKEAGTVKGEETWAALDEAVKRAKELGGSDPELIEAELMSELFRPNNLQQALERAKELTEEYPSEWRGPYYAAWALLKEGRGQEALDFLVEAQKRDSANPRIQQAIEGIKKGEANPFRGDLSFSDLSRYF